MSYRIVTAMLIIIICFTSSTAVFAAEKAPKITGIFSDMQFSRETGDVGGTEIFIVFSSTGYYAVVQCAIGEPGTPVVVPVTVEGKKISFTLPDSRSRCSGSFQGTVTTKRLKGRFDDESSGIEVSLPRQKSYWQ